MGLFSDASSAWGTALYCAMRRALRRRTAVVVFAPVGQPQQRWAALPSNVLSVQRAKGSAFAIIIDGGDDTNFWPIGFGFGLDATRGTRLLRAGFPAQVLCMACSRKMVRGCCCERRCPRSPQPYELLHLHSALRYDVGNRLLPTTLPAHCFTCDTPWEPLQALGCLLLHSKQLPRERRASF